MTQLMKNPPAVQETQVQSLGGGKIPWKRKWQPTPVFFPGESREQRSLVGNSPWSHRELDMTYLLKHHAGSVSVTQSSFAHMLMA